MEPSMTKSLNSTPAPKFQSESVKKLSRRAVLATLPIAIAGAGCADAPLVQDPGLREWWIWSETTDQLETLCQQQKAALLAIPQELATPTVTVSYRRGVHEYAFETTHDIDGFFELNHPWAQFEKTAEEYKAELAELIRRADEHWDNGGYQQTEDQIDALYDTQAASVTALAKIASTSPTLTAARLHVFLHGRDRESSPHSLDIERQCAVAILRDLLPSLPEAMAAKISPLVNTI
jgi:hypothetical protein